MIKLSALSLAFAAISFASLAASAKEGDCAKCELTAEEMEVKFPTEYPATAIFCMYDVALLISYLEDEGRICRPVEPTPQEEGGDVLKVVRAMSLEAKNRPEAEAVELAYQALVEDYPPATSDEKRR